MTRTQDGSTGRRPRQFLMSNLVFPTLLLCRIVHSADVVKKPSGPSQGNVQGNRAPSASQGNGSSRGNQASGNVQARDGSRASDNVAGQKNFNQTRGHGRDATKANSAKAPTAANAASSKPPANGGGQQQQQRQPPAAPSGNGQRPVPNGPPSNNGGLSNGANYATVQPPPGGARGRNAGGAAGAPAGRSAPVAADAAAPVAQDSNGARARDSRRGSRGGRGGKGGEGDAAAAAGGDEKPDVDAPRTEVDQQSRGGAGPERGGRGGRGGRKPRGSAARGEGGVDGAAPAPDAAAAAATTTAEFDGGADGTGQRSARVKRGGRGGRGSQGGAAYGGQPGAPQQVSAEVEALLGGDQPAGVPQEKKREPRPQREPRQQRGGDQAPQQGGAQREKPQRVGGEGEQQGAPRQQDQGRGPRQPRQQQGAQPVQPGDVERAEGGGGGGGRGGRGQQGRGGRRNNGGEDAAAPVAGANTVRDARTGSSLAAPIIESLADSLLCARSVTLLWNTVVLQNQSGELVCMQGWNQWCRWPNMTTAPTAVALPPPFLQADAPPGLAGRRQRGPREPYNQQQQPAPGAAAEPSRTGQPQVQQPVEAQHAAAAAAAAAAPVMPAPPQQQQEQSMPVHDVYQQLQQQQQPAYQHTAAVDVPPPPPPPPVQQQQAPPPPPPQQQQQPYLSFGQHQQQQFADQQQQYGHHYPPHYVEQQQHAAYLLHQQQYAAGPGAPPPHPAPSAAAGPEAGFYNGAYGLLHGGPMPPYGVPPPPPMHGNPNEYTRHTMPPSQPQPLPHGQDVPPYAYGHPYMPPAGPAPSHGDVYGPGVAMQPPAVHIVPAAVAHIAEPTVPAPLPETAVVQQQAASQPVPSQVEHAQEEQQQQQTAEEPGAAKPAADGTGAGAAAEPVKNEWAERLAQQALARMQAVKSSLLTGKTDRGFSYLRCNACQTQSLPVSDHLPHIRPQHSDLPCAFAPVPQSTGANPPSRSDSLSSASTYSRQPSAGRPPMPPSYSNGPLGNGHGSPRGPLDAADTSSSLTTRRSGYTVASNGDTAGWRNGPSADSDRGDSAGWRSANDGTYGDSGGWRSSQPSSRLGSRSMADEPPPAPSSGAYVPPSRREDSPPPSLPSAGSGRPKLNLQPRTKPLPEAAPAGAAAAASAAPAASATGAPVAAANGGEATATSAAAPPAAARTNSIFGAARPREEVLRQRGSSVAPEPDGHARLNSGTLTRIGNSSGPGSRAAPGSFASGGSEDDQWQTVGKGGKSKPVGNEKPDVGNALLDPTSDPFFTGARASSGVAISGRVAAVSRGFANGSFGQRGSFGSGERDAGGYMNAYGASRGYGNSYGNEDDDGPIFKRGLPTRANGLF